MVYVKIDGTPPCISALPLKNLGNILEVKHPSFIQKPYFSVGVGSGFWIWYDFWRVIAL